MELKLVFVAALSLLTIHTADGAAAKLPSSYPTCRRNDPDLNNCLTKALEKVLPQSDKGLPNLGVPSLDPMQVSAVDIGQGSGPVSVTLKFTNAKLYGLSKASLFGAMADLDKYSLDFSGKADQLRLESDYEMDGKILVVPVTGKGRCNITFDDLVCQMGVRGKAMKKSGETYFDVTDFPLTITDLGRLGMQFENLFNGDKALGETLNNLMNENWKDMWNELKPTFETTFSFIFKEYASRVFSKVAMKDIFIE